MGNRPSPFLPVNSWRMVSAQPLAPGESLNAEPAAPYTLPRWSAIRLPYGQQVKSPFPPKLWISFSAQPWAPGLSSNAMPKAYLPKTWVEP